VLARLARDILSIPASGAGVERLFNCARDVCHYRRGNLRAETIKELMLHQFSSKFELQQSELDMVKEYLSAGEAALIDQARKPIPQGPLTDLDPISDNEEEGNQEEVESDDNSDMMRRMMGRMSRLLYKFKFQYKVSEDSESGFEVGPLRYWMMQMMVSHFLKC
jgi:hypothetical protein